MSMDCLLQALHDTYFYNGMVPVTQQKSPPPLRVPARDLNQGASFQQAD